MGIYIEGLEAPKTGFIRIQLYDDGTVWAFQGFGWEHQEKKYIEIPTPHGRLIDTDALDETILKINSQEAYITRNDYKLIENVLFEMSTILEAEE